MTPAPKKTSQSAPGTQRYYSRAIGNGLRILEMLQMSGRPLSLAEITRQSNLPKSSVFRTLFTLELEGYIHRHEDDRFSAKASAGSSLNRMVRRVVDAADFTLKSLSHEFRETISLAFVFDNRIEVVSVINSPHRVSMGNEVGDIIPPHASSLGKCLVALQPESHRARLLRVFGMVPFTPHTITGEAALYREFDLVRSRGYATDIEESVLGGCCIGAPVFAPQGLAVAAVSISMPKMRFTDKGRLITEIRNASATINDALTKST